MSHPSYFPRYAYSGDQETQITAFDTTAVGQYVFGGIKKGDSVPYLGYYEGTSPVREYDIQFVRGGLFKYVAATKFTTADVASISGKLIFSILAPPTATDDVSVLITNPWEASTSNYSNLGLFKVNGLNDKRSMISNNSFILIDSDETSHHQVKLLMANEDEEGRRFNVYLVVLRVDSGPVASVTLSKKLQTVAQPSAPANSHLVNFLVPRKTGSAITEVLVGGPCYFQKSGNTFTNCLHMLDVDLSTATVESTLFRNDPVPSGYVETFDALAAQDSKFLGMMTKRQTLLSADPAETADDPSIMMGCDGIQQFRTGTLPFPAGTKAMKFLDMYITAAGDYSILTLQMPNTLFVTKGSLNIQSLLCADLILSQFSGVVYHTLNISPPSGGTINDVLYGRFIDGRDQVFVGMTATSSDSKAIAQFQYQSIGAQADQTVSEVNQIITEQVQSADNYGFFSRVATGLTVTASSLDGLVLSHTCDMRKFDPSKTCASDWTPASPTASIIYTVPTSINGQKTVNILDSRFNSADSSSCPLNCCSLMTSGCSSELTGLPWLSQPSRTSDALLFDSNSLQSGSLKTTTCVKCNNQYQDITTGDFQATICFPIKALTSKEKIINLSLGELDPNDAVFKFESLANPDCPQNLTYTIEQSSRNIFSDPILDPATGGQQIKVDKIGVPMDQQFILHVTDGQVTYSETVTFKITKDNPPPAPSPAPEASVPAPSDASYSIKLAPSFSTQLIDQNYNIEQTYKIEGSQLHRSHQQQSAVRIPLPSIKNVNHDLSKVRVKIERTSPSLYRPEIIKIADAEIENGEASLVLDFNRFEVLDYIRNKEELIAWTAGSGAGSVTIQKKSKFRVYLSIEEEGVELKGQEDFLIQITTVFTIQTTDYNPIEEGRLEITLDELDEEPGLSDEQLTIIDEQVEKTPGLVIGPSVPLGFLKEWANLVLSQEEKAGSNNIITPLTAWIDEVSTLGMVDIQFSHSLDKQLYQPQFITNDTLSVWVESEKDLGSVSSPATWELVVLLDSSMRIQLDFENAKELSMGEEPDLLHVDFLTNFPFRSRFSGSYLSNLNLTDFLSPQLERTPANIEFEAQAATAAETFTVVTLIILVGQYFMKGLLKKILTAILALQIVTVYSQIGVQLPANVVTFYRKLKPFISFDFVKMVARIIHGLFEFDMVRHKKLALQVLAPTLQDMGFKTFNTILNLGSLTGMLTIIFGQAALVILLLLIKKTLGLSKLSGIISWLGDTLFFGQILSLALNGFIPIYTSLVLSVGHHFTSPSGEMASIIFTAGVLGPLMLILALAVVSSYFSSASLRSHPLFTRACGRVYSNIRMENLDARFYYVVFLLRRLSIIHVAFSLGKSFSILMLLLMMMSNLLMTMYLASAKPKRLGFENKFELANDLVTSAAGYHLILFTRFNQNADAGFIVGWSFIGLLTLMLLTNFSFVLMDLLKTSLISTLAFLKKKKLEYEARRRIVEPNQVSKLAAVEQVHPSMTDQLEESSSSESRKRRAERVQIIVIKPKDEICRFKFPSAIRSSSSSSASEDGRRESRCSEILLKQPCISVSNSFDSASSGSSSSSSQMIKKKKQKKARANSVSGKDKRKKRMKQDRRILSMIQEETPDPVPES